MFETSLAEIMSRKVFSVPTWTWAEEAMELMWDKKISCVVVESRDKPVGILTERGILHQAVAGKDFSAHRVEDVMARPLVSLPKEESLESARKLMIEKRIRHLAVLGREGRIAGVLTLSDLVSALGFDYFCNGKPVREIMTAKVAAVPPGTGLLKAVGLMVERGISCVIAAENDRPVGVVTERDVAHRILGGLPLDGVSVGELMSSPVDTAPLDASTDDVVMFMKRKGIRRLVLVDDSGAIAGLLTQSNIVRGVST